MQNRVKTVMHQVAGHFSFVKGAPVFDFRTMPDCVVVQVLGGPDVDWVKYSIYKNGDPTTAKTRPVARSVVSSVSDEELPFTIEDSQILDHLIILGIVRRHGDPEHQDDLAEMLDRLETLYPKL